MARYKMTVVFDVHEEVEMRYVLREGIDKHISEMGSLYYEVLKGFENANPHINKLYEEVLERIETSHKHPITYDIVSFEKLKHA
jgi:hypothetical protein